MNSTNLLSLFLGLALGLSWGAASWYGPEDRPPSPAAIRQHCLETAPCGLTRDQLGVHLSECTITIKCFLHEVSE